MIVQTQQVEHKFYIMAYPDIQLYQPTMQIQCLYIEGIFQHYIHNGNINMLPRLPQILNVVTWNANDYSTKVLNKLPTLTSNMSWSRIKISLHNLEEWFSQVLQPRYWQKSSNGSPHIDRIISGTGNQQMWFDTHDRWRTDSGYCNWSR